MNSNELDAQSAADKTSWHPDRDLMQNPYYVWTRFFAFDLKWMPLIEPILLQRTQKSTDHN